MIVPITTNSYSAFVSSSFICSVHAATILSHQSYYPRTFSSAAPKRPGSPPESAVTATLALESVVTVGSRSPKRSKVARWTPSGTKAHRLRHPSGLDQCLRIKLAVQQ